jgi:hypothetical protein
MVTPFISSTHEFEHSVDVFDDHRQDIRNRPAGDAVDQGLTCRKTLSPPGDRSWKSAGGAG